MNRVSVLTSCFLFVVLPFTFFLIEADGFSFGPRSGLKAKFYETTITLLLLFAFVVTFFFVLVGLPDYVKLNLIWNCFKLALLGAFDVTSSWTLLLPQLVTEVTPMLRTFVSFCAIFMLLIGVPFGQQGLLEQATQAIIVVKPKSGIRADLRRITIERDHIRRRVSVKRTQLIVTNFI